MAKLTQGAMKLFEPDMSGVKNELAAIQHKAKRKGVTRDQREALTLRKHVALAAVSIVADDQRAKQHRELLAAHQETQKLLALAQGVGGTSFDGDSLQIPREGDPETPTH